MSCEDTSQSDGGEWSFSKPKGRWPKTGMRTYRARSGRSSKRRMPESDRQGPGRSTRPLPLSAWSRAGVTRPVQSRWSDRAASCRQVRRGCAGHRRAEPPGGAACAGPAPVFGRSVTGPGRSNLAAGAVVQQQVSPAHSESFAQRLSTPSQTPSLQVWPSPQREFGFGSSMQQSIARQVPPQQMPSQQSESPSQVSPSPAQVGPGTTQMPSAQTSPSQQLVRAPSSIAQASPSAAQTGSGTAQSHRCRPGRRSSRAAALQFGRRFRLQPRTPAPAPRKHCPGRPGHRSIR